MSVIFKKFIFDNNNQIIEDGTSILCEVENEAGDVNIIMMEKQNLLQAGYEIPDNNFNLNEMESQKLEDSQNFHDNTELNGACPDIKSNVDEWSDESTKLLLDKYADYLELVGPMKQFKNKKLMWIAIAKDLETVLNIKKTYIQCENRYKTILRRKRVSDKNNSTSGAKRIKVNFENEIKRIVAKDDSIEPEVLQSADNIIVNTKNINLSKEPKIIKKKTKGGILETLVEMHKEKEIKKQERHEEKMKLLKSFLEKENKDS